MDKTLAILNRANMTKTGLSFYSVIQHEIIADEQGEFSKVEQFYENIGIDEIRIEMETYAKENNIAIYVLDADDNIADILLEPVKILSKLIISFDPQAPYIIPNNFKLDVRFFAHAANSAFVTYTTMNSNPKQS
jgi:hypothetical protein